MHDITRYEITARPTNGNGPTYLIGYTPRLSKQGLLDAMRNVGQQTIDVLGITETDMFTFHTKPRAHCLVDNWTIGFTGRTKLQATQDGAHPWIAA